jgi:tRNA-dihydrouridine synthase C
VSAAPAQAPTPTPTLELRGPGRAVRIDPPTLLAPMDGVTDRAFRGMVAPLGGLGAAVSEFVRIAVAPVPLRVFRRELGDPIGVPVAVQLMMPDDTHLAASIANVERAGAAWIDLNFGCPAPVVFSKCAGSALLAHPERLARIFAVTLHARLRITGYHEPATWGWLAEARAALAACARPVPLIGNGGIDAPGDLARMRAETGVDAVMVGRAALADPFIFRCAAGGDLPDAAEAARWAVDYLDALGGGGPKAKQLARWFRAGGLLADPAERTALLRGPEPAIRAWFAARAGGVRSNAPEGPALRAGRTSG